MNPVFDFKSGGYWEGGTGSRSGGRSELSEIARYYYLHCTHESIMREVNRLNPFFIPVHNAMPGTQ